MKPITGQAPNNTNGSTETKAKPANTISRTRKWLWLRER